MMPTPSIDWEDAFANANYIPDGMGYPDIWAARAEAFRATHTGRLDIAYGDHARERFDLYKPSGKPKGLVVIVHGGYWLDFDKSSWTDLAEGPLSHGWAVALPSYTLAPVAKIPEITEQIAKAVTAAAAEVEGPIRLTGHSAGGHLVTRTVCDNGSLAEDVSSRIESVVSISGLHDLRPLLLNSMNDSLGLTEETATSESAALSSPLPHVRITAWVGACERPEFLRQSALLAESWGANLVADPEKHHFNVIDGLKDPGHALCLAVVGD